jgi:VRR-NUC domain
MRSIALTKPLEHNIQAAYIRWVHLAEKVEARLRLLFAVPNGGKRSMVTALALKREGVRAGVPDIMLPVACGPFLGLAIEFKRPGNTTTEKQDGYIDLLVDAGWLVVVCTDAEGAIRTTKDYLEMK